MKIAVVAIALLGFAAGLVFRLNVLIVILVFLLFLLMLNPVVDTNLVVFQLEPFPIFPT